MAARHKYHWPSLQLKLAKGAVYPLGSPFQYKHQLRLKATPEFLIYTYWSDDTCLASGYFTGAPARTWEQLFAVLEEQKILSIPCVGVGISVWNEQNLLMRPDSRKDMALSVVNQGLRHQPESIRKDLLSTGIYAYCAIALDEQKTMIYGIPLGYEAKEAARKFPEAWATVAWAGMVAFPFYKLRTATLPEISCHTILTQKTAINLLLQNHQLKYLQQDRMLVDSQDISMASVSKFQLLFNLFPCTQIQHYLYPVDVQVPWANNLRTFLLNYKWTAATEMVGPEPLHFPNVPPEIHLQDMFPTGTPWSA